MVSSARENSAKHFDIENTMNLERRKIMATDAIVALKTQLFISELLPSELLFSENSGSFSSATTKQGF